MFLEKDPDDRLDFLEAALLAAQRKHLESKNAGCGFRLQALPNREGILSQAFALFEAAAHQGPHGPKHCGEGKHEGFVDLFPQASPRVEFCVGRTHISQLEQAIPTPELTVDEL